MVNTALIKELKAKRRELAEKSVLINRLEDYYNDNDDRADSVVCMLDEDSYIINELLNKIDDILDFYKPKKQFNLTDEELLSLAKKHNLIKSHKRLIKHLRSKKNR